MLTFLISASSVGASKAVEIAVRYCPITRVHRVVPRKKCMLGFAPPYDKLKVERFSDEVRALILKPVGA